MGDTQLILTIGREFGSGGLEIAQKLAEHYGLPVYDKNLIQEVLEQKGIYDEQMARYDETRKRMGIYRAVRGMDSSPEAIIAHMQFDFLKERAEAGDSFVVVGRCAETILRDFQGVISIFVLGDKAAKIERVSQSYELSREEAERIMKEMDTTRKKYHNNYCEGKWGDSRNYDISMNSSKLGIDETVEALVDYIERRRKLK